MAAVRRALTVDGEYTITRGAPENDDTHISTVILLLRLRHGTCPVNPSLGNRIYAELGKLGDDAPRRAEQFAVTALEPLTRTRFITELDVEAIEGDSGRLDLDVSFRDKDGAQRTIRLPISRGA